MLKGITSLTASCFFFFILFLCPSGVFTYEIKPFDRESFFKKKPSLKLVFCPLDYHDKKTFEKDVQGIIGQLSKTRPFDEFNSFAVWKVDLTEKETAQLFKPTQDFPPLKVRNDFLEEIFLRINAEYKLIIIDAQGTSSCAELSSRGETSLIILGKARYKDNNSLAKGFLHELGHSLGLRDECVNCAQLSPAGFPNCAETKEEAQEYWGDLISNDPRVNYISGCCGNKDYIRPTIASLMNDPDKAKDFGPVNERYLWDTLAGIKRR